MSEELLNELTGAMSDEEGMNDVVPLGTCDKAATRIQQLTAERDEVFTGHGGIPEDQALRMARTDTLQNFIRTRYIKVTDHNEIVGRLEAERDELKVEVERLKTMVEERDDAMRDMERDLP